MIYTPLTLRAMQAAYAAHEGQADKSGMPYIMHPLHVAESMEDEVTCCAALLHDVAEDTDITLEQLAEQFPAEVIEVLRLLTHDPVEPYMAYVERIAQNAAARRVKLSDLRHNMDSSRLKAAGLPVNESRLERYRRAEARLLAAEAGCKDQA